MGEVTGAKRSFKKQSGTDDVPTEMMFKYAVHSDLCLCQHCESVRVSACCTHVSRGCLLIEATSGPGCTDTILSADTPWRVWGRYGQHSSWITCGLSQVTA